MVAAINSMMSGDNSGPFHYPGEDSYNLIIKARPMNASLQVTIQQSSITDRLLTSRCRGRVRRFLTSTLIMERGPDISCVPRRGSYAIDDFYRDTADPYLADLEVLPPGRRRSSWLEKSPFSDWCHCECGERSSFNQLHDPSLCDITPAQLQSTSTECTRCSQCWVWDSLRRCLPSLVGGLRGWCSSATGCLRLFSGISSAWLLVHSWNLECCLAVPSEDGPDSQTGAGSTTLKSADGASFGSSQSRDVSILTSNRLLGSGI